MGVGNEIYKGYNYDDVISNHPYIEGDLHIYPIRLYELKAFNQYTQYIVLSKKHYGIGRKDSFLNTIISYKIKDICPNFEELDNESKFSVFGTITKDICGLFSMVSHEPITYTYDENKGHCFGNEENSYMITDKNFNHIRKIILRQNLLLEPKIYEDELVKEWEEKAMKARNKNSSLNFCEMKNIVRCGLGISYEEVDQLNICQFKFDFYRLCNNRDALALDILRTTYGIDTKKLPDIKYTDSVLSLLLKDPSEELWKEQSSTNIGKAMGL